MGTLFYFSTTVTLTWEVAEILIGLLRATGREGVKVSKTILLHPTGPECIYTLVGAARGSVGVAAAVLFIASTIDSSSSLLRPMGYGIPEMKTAFNIMREAHDFIYTYGSNTRDQKSSVGQVPCWYFRS